MYGLGMALLEHILQNTRHFTGFLLMYLLCFVLFKEILENRLAIFFFKLFTVCNKCKSIFIYFVMSKNMDIVQCNGYETNKRLLTLHVVVGVGHKVIVFNLRDELFLSNRI